MGTNGRNGYSVVDLRPMGPLRSTEGLAAFGRNGTSVLLYIDQHDPYNLGQIGPAFERAGARMYVVDNEISKRLGQARREGVVIISPNAERAKELGITYVHPDKIEEYVSLMDKKIRVDSNGNGHI